MQRALDARLTVVTGLPRPDRWTEVRAGTVELLARDRGRGTVTSCVDTGFSLEQDDELGGRPGRNQMTLAALDVADEVVVVGTADPVGLSRLARGLVDLRERPPGHAGPGGGQPDAPDPRLVRARRRRRWWPASPGPVGLHFLPEDRAAVDRALVTGRTLLETAPDSPLVAAVCRPGRERGRRRRALAGRPATGWLRRRTAGRARRR